MGVKRKPHTSRTARASLDRRYIGDEPIDVWVKGYTQALNWYNDSCEPEDARSWLIEYMTAGHHSTENISLVEEADIKFIPTTIGWISRMILNGNQLADKSYDYFDSRLETLLKREKKFGARNSTPVLSVKVRTENKTAQIITEIEEQLDLNGKNFSLFKYLKARQLSPTIVRTIEKHYMPFLNEVLDHTDPDIKEAFGKELNNERIFWFNFISDCAKFLPSNKKPRAKTSRPRTLYSSIVGN